MTNKDEVVAKLERLIAQGIALPGDRSFISPESNGDAQYWLSGTVATLEGFLPVSSFHFTEAVRLAERSHRQGGIIRSDVNALLGHLRFLRDAVDKGELSSLQNELSAADFAEFLQHARQYLAEEKKVEASVIAAAVFEDTVKRLGRAFAIEDLSKLDATINALKSKGAVTSVEAKQLRYLAGVRNAALHASWDEFELDAVSDLIDGVDRLLTVLAAAP